MVRSKGENFDLEGTCGVADTRRTNYNPRTEAVKLIDTLGNRRSVLVHRPLHPAPAFRGVDFLLRECVWVSCGRLTQLLRDREQGWWKSIVNPGNAPFQSTGDKAGAPFIIFLAAWHVPVILWVQGTVVCGPGNTLIFDSRSIIS